MNYTFGGINMNKSFLRLLLLTIVANYVNTIYADDTFEVNGAYYSVYNSKGVTLEGFKDNLSIINYTIPETITYNTKTLSVVCVGEKAFKDCNNLVSLTVPGSVEKLGSFENCNKFKKVVFKESDRWLYGIGYLRPCPIEELYIGRNISRYINHSSLSKTLEEQPFRGKKIKKLEFGSKITEIDKWLFYKAEITQSVILFPKNIKKVLDKAFLGCDKINSIIFEESSYDDEKNGLERIEEGAFSGCSGLKEVSFPRTLERIGYYSFSGCGLETLAIPDNVTTISDKAFRGCQNLNIITIGSGVKLFCYEIFYDCPNIKYVTIKIIDPEKCEYRFSPSEPFLSNVYANAVLFVPTGSLDQYINHYYWGKFFNIQEYKGTGISSVHITPTEDCFYNLQGIKFKHLQNGIMIIREKNGVAKKILAK